jgi:hypothetical protein
VGPNGDDFYTQNESDRTTAISQGYKDEGTLGYVASSEQPGTVPLHRLYNPSTRIHYYTILPNEVASAVGQGFHEEGIAGYVWHQ